MGALFHQFIGTPVSSNNAESLEKAMEDAMHLQPCIKEVRVKINREKLKEIENDFQYVSLTGDMLDVRVISAYKDHQATIRLKYVEELKYPLMYVEKVG